MQTIRLPQELIEAIVAQTDDRSTLLDCALVCRSWAAAAQRKLFETVVLAPTLFSGLSSTITKTPIITRLHALASVSPHLLHYVKVLEFDPTCDAVHYLFGNTTTLKELRVVNFTGEMAKGIEEINTMLSIPSVTRLSVREGPLYPGEIVPLLLN
ncbi:hypothetical protein CYLTODRAFT_118878 [Cylindrobasidium torrendii FP15055 ss-10]|uniref:F-box domain-containing protein n=1 Tax=Cylindrobasidium torrendii FP15055 ss-10 TaxID=1314674 RepID=A0A0D7B375_9AGAR|nr:hypothetical protein CYLTODRAFT_118878 [Cylindrobasidium torrendii FP15055 ss-10]